MIRQRHNAYVPFQVLTACLLCVSLTYGAKPTGGGGGSTPAYTIVAFDPGEAPSRSSAVVDLNDADEAIGTVEYVVQQYESYHLDLVTGVYTPLPDAAAAINNNGQIVGGSWWYDSEPSIAWILSSAGAEPLPLPSLKSDADSYATDINDSQIIVGHSEEPAPSFSMTAVVWRVGVDEYGMPAVDGPLVLPPLNGDDFSYAKRINDSDGSVFQVVGGSFGPTHYEAVVWTVEIDGDGALISPAAPVGLGMLPGANTSEGFAINAGGDACGKSVWFPFVSTVDGGIQPLPLPRDTQEGWALDINDGGKIVGQLDIHKITRTGTGWPQDHAWLWSNGKGVDLETQIGTSSGWDQLWGANRITNGGVIAGYGRYDVEHRGFVMFPSK